MNTLNDTFLLHNGVGIPCVGFGTWLATDGKIAMEAVQCALGAGYRHIDTAAAYGNEKSVGQAVKASGIPREKLFITSKLWNTDRGYEAVLKAFDKSISNLEADYLDLYLVHWPAKGVEGANINADTWRAFERLYREGRIKAIGVSNFLVHHLQPLVDTAEIMPMVNQIEYHPGQTQPEIVAFCQTHNILVEAWGPLGRGKMLTDERLVNMAVKYRKTVAQLCLHWCLQNGVLPLPKSVTPQRIVENTQVFDFVIDKQDMAIINTMPYFGGSGLHPDTIDY